MAIAFDAFSSVAFKATSVTHAHTTAGSDRLLVVAIVLDGSDNTTTTSAVSYGGVAMTLIQNESTDQVARLYYLLNPAAGANNVSITLSSTPFYNCGVLVSSYTGIHQSAALDVSDKIQGSTTSARVSLTTTNADDLLIAVVSSNGYNNAYTPSTGMTERYDATPDTFYRAFLGDQIVTTTGTYSIGADNTGMSGYAEVAAAFKASGTAPPPTNTGRFFAFFN